MFSRITSFNYF